jgi:hypothetical protein
MPWQEVGLRRCECAVNTADILAKFCLNPDTYQHPLLRGHAPGARGHDRCVFRAQLAR